MGEIKKKENMGVLVLLGVLSIAITIFLSLGELQSATLPFSFDSQWNKITDLSANTYNKEWSHFVIYQFANYIFIFIITLTLFIIFLNQSKYFPTALVVYFMVRLLLLALLYYLQTVTRGPATPTISEIISSSISTLAIPGVWIPYILLSEKAKETFIY